MKRSTIVVRVSLIAGVVVCALVFLKMHFGITDTDRFGPNADFLLFSKSGLELGISRESLMSMRRESILDGGPDPGEFSPTLVEEVKSEDGQRRILYIFPDETQVLSHLFYSDVYPASVLDERIERKLRAATTRWGHPVALSAERQGPSMEYFVAVWRPSSDTTLTISYVPREARREDTEREYPVLTAFFLGSLEDHPRNEIEPKSFDLIAERDAFSERIRGWENE